MKTSIATVSVPGDLNDKLKSIADAGFTGIELFEQEFIAYSETPAEIGQMVRDHGLTIDLFQPMRDARGMPEPQPSHIFDRIERRFDVMAELGADLLLLSSSSHPGNLGGTDRITQVFSDLGDRAVARGRRGGHEALNWGRNVKTHIAPRGAVGGPGHQAM